MQLQLDSRYRAVEKFIARAEASDVPEEIKGDLYKFATVLICGNIERSVEIIVLHRLTNKAQPRVLNFIKSYFVRGTNFDCNATSQLLSRFDGDWYRRFVDFVEANQDVKEGVASCYSVRNSVAHGGTAGIGSKRLNELLLISRKMIDAVVTATS